MPQMTQISQIGFFVFLAPIPWHPAPRMDLRVVELFLAPEDTGDFIHVLLLEG
jgi:hypothetical protein